MVGDDFSAFPDETLDFLAALKANNNREWFAASKHVYERAFKAPADAFCLAMTERLQGLTGKTHRSKIFRIHRDLRFSRDKTPYNAHLHISFIPKSGGASPPCWFFGLSPELLTLGAGIFVFDKGGVETYRKRIVGSDGPRLVRILASLQRDNIQPAEPELKRVPAGFDKDHPRADLLRRKSLAVWRNFDDVRMATRPDFTATCLAGFKRLKPVYDWLS